MKKNIKILFLVIFLIILFIYVKKEEKLTTDYTSEVLWGAYTGDTVLSFVDFQNQVGKKADIQAIFMDWDDPFPLSLANHLKTNSQTLLIYWEQYEITLDQIINGESDYYIKQFVIDVKEYGGPVILVPFHEMNGDWYSWSGTVGNNTSAKVINAFKHIHNLFNRASNIKWGWSVNNSSVPDTEANKISAYYPGDQYVDIVGVDGFNFGDPWQTYNEVFSSSLVELSSYNKPIYIFSMASASGAKKADWITDAFSQIYSNTAINGWIWFNENKEQNWLVQSDPNSLEAFRMSIK